MAGNCKHPSEKKGGGPRVLDLLGEAEGWRSGEEISGMLGVSRAAVAKNVAALRRLGHVIDACTNRGYRLRIRYEPTCSELVHPYLKTRMLGKNDWKSFGEIASTNTEAITWALSGGKEGAVVTAEAQTQGKGRKGKDWFSSPHGLQFSVILRPKGDSGNGAAITQAALGAAARAIEKLTRLKTAVKQPNDILIGGKKVSGILVETGSRAGELDWVAVGIGCNVNVLPEEFPDSIRDAVTSLYQESGEPVSKNRLLAEILNGFEKELRIPKT